jgi:hypothetical protein
MLRPTVIVVALCTPGALARADVKPLELQLERSTKEFTNHVKTEIHCDEIKDVEILLDPKGALACTEQFPLLAGQIRIGIVIPTRASLDGWFSSDHGARIDASFYTLSLGVDGSATTNGVRRADVPYADGWTMLTWSYVVAANASNLKIEVTIHELSIVTSKIGLGKRTEQTSLALARLKRTSGPAGASARVAFPAADARYYIATDSYVERLPTMLSKATLAVLEKSDYMDCQKQHAGLPVNTCVVSRGVANGERWLPAGLRRGLGGAVIEKTLVTCEASVDERDWWPIARAYYCRPYLIVTAHEQFGIFSRSQEFYSDTRARIGENGVIEPELESVSEPVVAPAQDMAERTDPAYFDLSKCASRERCKATLRVAFLEVTKQTLESAPFLSTQLLTAPVPGEFVFTRRDKMSRILEAPYVESARYRVRLWYQGSNEDTSPTDAAGFTVELYILVKKNPSLDQPYRDTTTNELTRYQQALDGLPIRELVCARARGSADADRCVLH